MVIWWPGLHKSTEGMVSNRLPCQSSKSLPPHLWSVPQIPWSTFHIYYAEPLHNHMFLMIVDARILEIAIEIIPVKNATSSVTIDKLRGMCSTQVTTYNCY